MKGAIASVELYAFSNGQRTAQAARRLTLTIGEPVREPGGAGGSEWSCRVVLADLHRPETVYAADSVSALSAVLAIARQWLSALDAQGIWVAREPTGETPFVLNG